MLLIIIAHFLLADTEHLPTTKQGEQAEFLTHTGMQLQRRLRHNVNSS